MGGLGHLGLGTSFGAIIPNPHGNSRGSPDAGGSHPPGSVGIPTGTRNDFGAVYLAYVEYSHRLNGMWKGMNGEWNSIHWGGNGATGARSIAIKIANGAHYAGYLSLGLTVTLEGRNAYNSYEAGNWAGVGNAGANMFFAGVMTIGGLPGTVIGGIYFGVEGTVGWGSVGKSFSQFILEHPGWNPYGGYDP